MNSNTPVSATEGASAPNDEAAARLRSVRRLARLFRWERIIYLGAAGAVAAVLLAAAMLGSEGSLVLLLGAVGLLLFILGRVVDMWDRAYGLMPEEKNQQADGQ